MPKTADPREKNQKPNGKNEGKSIFSNVFFYAFLFLILFGIISSASYSEIGVSKKPISDALSLINAGEVNKVTVEGDSIRLELKDGTKVLSHKEETISFDDILKNNNIDTSKVPGGIEVKVGIPWGALLFNFAPALLSLALLLFLLRQMRGAGSDMFSFGKSKAKLFNEKSPQVKFSDVAGSDEAKAELVEIVDFLKNPSKYRALGARIPKGVLLVGPSGVGKTLLAKAVSGEAGVPFFSVAGSEFMEMLVGVGSARVRDLFEIAKAAQPSLIFIDEVDAIGRQRGMGIGGGHDEREQTLNQILVEMDGFDPRTSVIVIAASVTGDTPVMIKENDVVSLRPISEIVDRYYEPFEEGVEISSPSLQALSYEQNGKTITPKFTDVRGVFRHKVNEIYEIEYLGGKVRATGNHSVFIWEGEKVVAKPVTLLKKGDVLVDITPKKFDELGGGKEKFEVYIKVGEKNAQLQETFDLVMQNKGVMSQSQLSDLTGFAQTTVSLWHRGVNGPRELSNKYYIHDIPDEIKVTPDLMRLFGYYTAEGYARKEVDFCFNEKEVDYIEDVKKLMFDIFGLSPHLERHKTHGAVNIIYHSVPVANVFKTYCGSGARNKHAPTFLFEAPFEYFKEYLCGYSRGDGHINKQGELIVVSVSKRLITELVWLARIHGMKAFFTSFATRGGRVINGGKPLASSTAYRLGLGKYYNLFNGLDKSRIDQRFKKPVIKKIRKLDFDGYVYDFCGCSNEAFFIGINPIVGHNTNRPDMLDPALIRPGRFDRRVILTLPDLRERQEIIKIHMRGKPFVSEINTERLAKRTVGFSGADIENMLNEAAIFAARFGKKAIEEKDLEEAALKVQLGPEKKKMQSEEEKKMVAYHEAGHALVASLTEGMDPVHRISIISRGLSLGFTLFPPATERYNETKSRLLSMITTSLGGRAAEELVFKEQTVGASNDIEKATEIARRMVTEFGMSDLGPISFNGKEERFWLAREIGERSSYSQEVAAKIDAEVKKIIDESYSKARKILVENREKLDKVAEELIKKESLDSDEFKALIGVE